MTHYRAMQEKLAGDVDDDLHHSNHGVYEDVRLPHRDKDDAETDSERLQEET